MRLKPVVSFWESLRVRSKLKNHAAEAGGILQIMQRSIVRSKLKNHAAEADGIDFTEGKLLPRTALRIDPAPVMLAAVNQ